MNQVEKKLLKQYLSIKDRPANFREVIQPFFLLNFALFVPMFIGALVIFYFGVKEAAYIVLGLWLGMFLSDIRHGRVFVTLWPSIKKYLDWEKIEKSYSEQESS
jgi:hypothetical protein